MFGKMRKLISVLLMLAMLANGTGVFAEEIIMIFQGEEIEIETGEELPVQEETEEAVFETFFAEEPVCEIEEETIVSSEEEAESQSAQIQLSLAKEIGGGLLIEEDYRYQTTSGNKLVGYTGPGGNIVIPDGVIYIDKNVFKNNTSITGVTFPSTLLYIDAWAFQGCTGLKSLTIPANIDFISQAAFAGCTGLTSVTLPATLRTAGGLFEGCTGLTTAVINGDNLDSQNFMGCTSLKNVTLSNSVTRIGGSAFEGCTALKSISIPGSVTEIGSSAFENCTALSDISFQEGLSIVGDEAFMNCDSLESITLPKSVTSIGWGAFRECENLDSAVVSGDIGVLAFYGCTGLCDVVIRDGATKIDASAFEGCYNLRSLTIPGSVTDIDYTAMTNTVYPYLNVVVDKGSKAHDFCKSYNHPYTFSGDDYKDSFTIRDGYLSYYTGNEAVVSIPKGVVDIGMAFEDRDGISEVVIPDGVKTISSSFTGCDSLNKINFPSTLTMINGAFVDCISLEEAIIFAPVELINAFQNCINLKYVSFGEKVRNIGEYCFKGCIDLEEIYIPSRVVSIGREAFKGCSNLQKVTFGGDNLEQIDDEAFANCLKLESVELPESVTELGSSAFANCVALKTVKLPSGLVFLSDYTFNGCVSLTSVNIPGDTRMGYWTEAGERIDHAGVFDGCIHSDLMISVVANSEGHRYCEEYGLPYKMDCNHKWGKYVTIIDPSCEEAGLKERTCSKCKAVDGTLIPATGHTEVTIPGKDIACGQDGLTEGKKCKVCKKITVEQLPIPALDHIPEVDPYIAPTETSCGRTAGTHCANCGMTLVKQQLIPGLMPALALNAKNTKTVTIMLGECVWLEPAYAANKGWTITKWSSSNKKVAKVDGDGVVTPVAEGTVTITATASKKNTMTVKIKVADPKKPTKVVLDKTGTQKLNMGETLTLTTTLQPTTAAADSYSWKTSSKKIATVKDGVITPVGEGTATITVTATRGKVKKTASMKVKVVDPYKPTKIVLDKTGTHSLNIGDQLTLTPKLEPTTAMATISWKSSNKKIAKITDGVVEGLKEGTVTITATAIRGKVKKTASMKVKVVDPKKPTKVTLNLTGTQKVDIDKTLELVPTLTPTTASATYSWKTSDKKIATVKDGIVTPVKEGTVTITVTATYGKTKKTASVKVKVVDPYKPTKVVLDKTGTQTMAKGETLTLNPSLEPTNAKANYKWKSSNKKVAIVENGVVTAKGKGKAVITVSAIRGNVTKTAKVTIQVK